MFKLGDRVRIAIDNADFSGRKGTISKVDSYSTSMLYELSPEVISEGSIDYLIRGPWCESDLENV